MIGEGSSDFMEDKDIENMCEHFTYIHLNSLLRLNDLFVL